MKNLISSFRHSFAKIWQLVSPKELAFCTIANESFAIGAETLIKSAKINGVREVFYCIDAGLSHESKIRITKAGGVIIKQNRAIPFDHPRFGPAYALFDIGQLPCQKIIYLDADMLIIEDLAKLKDIAKAHPISVSPANSHLSLVSSDYKQSLNRIIEAAPESVKKHLSSEHNEIIHKSTKYISINTGILRIDTKLMRLITNSANNFFPIFGELNNPDQELLSIVLCDMNIQPNLIPWQYNATYTHGTPDSRDGRLRQVTIKDLNCIEWEISHLPNGNKSIKAVNTKTGFKTDLSIIHFITKDKPWLNDNSMKTEFKKLWSDIHEL